MYCPISWDGSQPLTNNLQIVYIFAITLIILNTDPLSKIWPGNAEAIALKAGVSYIWAWRTAASLSDQVEGEDAQVGRSDKGL